MSEDFAVNTKNLANWEPHEGDGPSAWMTQDGEYRVQIKKAKASKVEKSGNIMITCTLQVLDEDAEPRGAILYLNTVISGTDKNGDDNARHLGDLLYSAGRDKDSVRKLAAAESVKTEGIIKGLTSEGKNVAHVSVTTSEYQGKYRSECNWIRPERYTEQKGANAHRRPRAIGGATGAPRQPAAPTGGSANGVAAGAKADDTVVAGI